MANRLRIARLDPRPYHSLAVGPGDANLHRRLDALIRRHLAGPTASLLAAPASTADGRFVEWYSDLNGQPVPLRSLSPSARPAVEALLANRLGALAALAERLEAADSEPDLARALRQALSYPGEETVYVVDGQPVLTFWGYRPLVAAAAEPAEATAAAAAGPAAAAAAMQAAEHADGRRDPRRRFPGRLVAISGIFALVLMAAGLFAGGLIRWPPWGPDYAALLKTAGDDERALHERLAALTDELEDRRGYCDLQRTLLAAKTEEDRLAGSLSTAVDAVAAAHELCPLRAALAASQREGGDLEKRRSSAAEILVAQLERCRKQAEAEARKAADARKQAEAERKQAEAERKKAEAERKKAEAERRQTEKAQAAAEAATKQPPAPSDQAGQPPPAPPQRSTPPGLPPCPGERTPEEAPDAAIVLDASGSMRLPATASLAEIQGLLSQLGPLGMLGGAIFGQVAGGPTRLEAAKKGVNGVVASMPDDVDVGLVTLRRCPSANNEGFFSSAERNRLYARVNALSPMEGTPLAQGIMQAGQMIDGVKAPAVMVVISDGDDSCGGDPCAAAQALHESKPLLKINVVDILGNGTLSCLARATGGQVIKPGDGVAFEKAIKQAAQDAIKPAHCH